MTDTVLVPSAATLKKYGITEEDWHLILDRQGGVCAICGNVPPSRRLVIDHEHVRGWKAMPPEARRKYVRGLICMLGNRYWLGRGMTLAKARAVVWYLEDYELRRSVEEGGYV